VGELSTSALSTAVAVSALSLVQKARHGSFDSLITGGLEWLANHPNPDGGWGDTVKSLSNISTTMLCRAAFHLCGRPSQFADCLSRSEAWLAEKYGRTPAELAEAVRRRYGKDRTFSVPILMTSALAGLVSWQEVPSLPFELACFPQPWFRFLQLPVVSYALPALIAIGQAVHHHRPPRNPFMRLLRRLAKSKSLRVLAAVQPPNGGFLEAAPLTGFVALGLASIGQAKHPIVRKCIDFLVASVRSDGSWPIDTNLSTWVTTLSINALATAGELDKIDRLENLVDFLRKQQYLTQHPYTGAEPGAWAWTDLPGGVPDADDTPGSCIALFHLAMAQPRSGRGAPEVEQGLTWLLRLQNADGGWPTFCRGWTQMPFDRSGADLTAHALRALGVWQSAFPTRELGRAIRRGLEYLARTQAKEGFWLPLWFGNQYAPGDINPTYGTAKVLAAYRELSLLSCEQPQRGLRWLVANQNGDGGWGAGQGTPSSVEETALAVEAILGFPDAEEAAERGLAWLVERIEADKGHEATPIGFYFAKLWYFERLYPLVFTVAALGRACRQRREQA
jgi:squalene-hopene/tetraprenyl-beta-curcumene cyclase